MPRGEDFRSAVASSPGNSLVASSRVYSQSNTDKLIRKVNQRQVSRQWQSDLWEMYDIVPEFRTACDWVGNSISKAVLTVQKDAKPTTDQLALDALASLFGGAEGQREMLRLLGIHFTLAGEAFIIGRSKDGEDDWNIYAAIEVQADSFGRVISAEGEEIEAGALPIRMWKAHPRRTNEANSPARAVLPTLAQIVKLQMVIDAQADSRLTSAGILFVPDEIELPNVPGMVTVSDPDDPTNSESFEATPDSVGDALFNAMTLVASKAIQDRGKAAAQVPLVIAAPGEYLEKVNHVSFWSGFDEHVKGLRAEAIGRIGTGMDMPPEVLTGTGDVNHWGSWQIEEAAIKSYTEPLLDIIVEALTTGYLHSWLRGNGVEDYKSYRFAADTSKMRLRPNRSKEAVELYDRGALSRSTMLTENGFDPENDAMSDEERREFVLLKMASGSATPEQVAAAAELLGIKGIPAEDIGELREARPDRSLEGHPTRTAPDPEDSEAQDAIVASAAIPIDGLVWATEQMVYRALERAGNRLKAKIGRSVAVSAAELYMTIPAITPADAESLLTDAWTCLDRFDYPGVSNARLESALQNYAATLLRLQKPLDRSSLALFLQHELSADPVAA